uniref:Putative salivary lipocalin n=1 Tax=Ixodes ricinus TaxID=34613 RepID=A0A0K8RH28_IXORI
MWIAPLQWPAVRCVVCVRHRDHGVAYDGGLAPSFHWTRNMTIKNPENRPTFNYPELGPLQDAWQVLEETSNNTYFLMFRTHVSVYKRCVYATANIADKARKTANYTVAFYYPLTEKYENTTVQVKALSQTDYPLENVIRANLKGTLPSATPVPPGSYTRRE